MPIYLVKWDNDENERALVRARDPKELADILDEVGDPSGAYWVVYNGPLWIDFTTQEAEGSEEDEEPRLTTGKMWVNRNADTADEMDEAISRKYGWHGFAPTRLRAE